jgi:hypothetical protein
MAKPEEVARGSYRTLCSTRKPFGRTGQYTPVEGPRKGNREGGQWEYVARTSRPLGRGHPARASGSSDRSFVSSLSGITVANGGFARREWDAPATAGGTPALRLLVRFATLPLRENYTHACPKYDLAIS